MVLSKLWNYVRGYATVELDGMGLEKVINQITTDVPIHRLKRVGHKFCARISYTDLKRIKAIIPEGRCVFRVREVKGVPKYYRILKPRKMLFYGLALAVIIYTVASCFVWKVSIEGVEGQTRDKLARLAVEAGVERFTAIWKLNGNSAENYITAKMPELAWLAIVRQGAKVRIKAVEMKQPAQIIDRSTPSNLISNKDAVICRMMVLQGQAKIKEGDTVKKGDILISGLIKNQNESLGQEIEEVGVTRAMGSVIAIVRYSTTVKVPLWKTVKEYTGRTSRDKLVSIAGKRFVTSQGEQYTKFDLQEVSKTFMGNLGLPVEYITVSRREYIEKKVSITESEAISNAEKLGYEQVKKIIPSNCEYSGKETEYEIKDNELILKYHLDVLENIAVEQPIE